MDTEPNNTLANFRPWTDLPIDILSSIADRLAIIELLSFRGTCKDFRSSSTTASAKIESSRVPWLYFHKPDSSKCLIYNTRESKTYNRNIPELEGAICLASNHGWLLLFKHESIFFFCPFSLAKISLPDFPHKQMDKHVASFSDLPTSPHCIISIINPVDNSKFELNVISKGQTVWTQHMVSRSIHMSTNIVAATFCSKTQTFNYLGDGEYSMTFSVEDKSWKIYKTMKGNSVGTKNTLSFGFYSVKGLFDKIKKRLVGLDLEEDECVHACGLTYQNEKSCQVVYHNEEIKVSSTNNRIRRGVWVQPRFFEVDPNHHW